VPQLAVNESDWQAIRAPFCDADGDPLRRDALAHAITAEGVDNYNTYRGMAGYMCENPVPKLGYTKVRDDSIWPEFTDWRGIDLSHGDLCGTDFIDVDLTGADLSYTWMNAGTQLRYATSLDGVLFRWGQRHVIAGIIYKYTVGTVRLNPRGALHKDVVRGLRMAGLIKVSDYCWGDFHRILGKREKRLALNALRPWLVEGLDYDNKKMPTPPDMLVRLAFEIGTFCHDATPLDDMGCFTRSALEKLRGGWMPAEE
jgi:hypothetical protein